MHANDMATKRVAERDDRVSGSTYASACAAYGAWLGAMLERTQRGNRPLPRVRNETAVEAQASAFGVVPCATIHFDFAPNEYWQRWLPRYESAIDVLVERVAKAAADWRYEDAFLAWIVAYCPCTPSSRLVQDIIDRGLPESIQMLGHSNLEDRHLWQLVDQVHEAGETLALRRYCDPAATADQLAEVLHQLPHLGLARWLASEHFTPSSCEKAERVAKLLREEAKTTPIGPRARARWHPMVTEAVATFGGLPN